MDVAWEKPVIVFFRERLKEPDRKAFAVVKAKRLVILGSKEGSAFWGTIEDFFSLMGDVDYISSREGTSDRYILCWFDDVEEDFSKSWRRLVGVTFPSGVTFTTDERGKRSYTANFNAEHGKIT